MSGVRFIIGVSAGSIAGIVLAGCTSSSTPDWLKPAPPPPQALQFESTPSGASVQTAQGQTCRTPCSLAVPVMSQSVTVSMDGYVAQTVPINMREPERSIFNKKPPDLVPNPVQVALVAVPPPPKVKPKLRRGVAAPKAVRTPVAVAPPPMPSVAPAPRPIAAPEPQDSTFPHPTPWSQSPVGSESPIRR
jgi:hypothetical protein